MIHAMVRSFVLTSGAGTSRSGPDYVDDLCGVAARDALQFAIRQHRRIADHAAFGAAEGNVDDGAFPRHPRGERAHFIQRYVGRKADAALAGAAHHGMLHAIAGEDFEAAVIKLHGNVDGDFAGWAFEDFANAIVQPEPRGGVVDASFGR